MRVIQTVYKGYKFRSRLEARWAVFLDHLKANWSYEQEGYALGGQWYLPDFFVSDWNCWIEIKGQKASDSERAKCQALARESGKQVLLLVGDPWLEPSRNLYDITLFDRDRPEYDGSEGWEFGQGRHCPEEIWLVNDEIGAYTLRPVPHAADDKDKYPLSGPYAVSIAQALTAARQARFEHGEHLHR